MIYVNDILISVAFYRMHHDQIVLISFDVLPLTARDFSEILMQLMSIRLGNHRRCSAMLKQVHFR